MGFFIAKYARSATVVVAASDSKDKANADYICDGTDDQAEINSAIAALGTVRGAVILLEGTYNITAPVNLASNVALVGQGAGTVLRVPNGHNASLNVISGNSIDHVLVANLRVDGNRANQTAGGMHGMWFITVTHSKIVDCWVENMRNYGIYIYYSSNDTFTGNNVQSNGLEGIYIYYSSNNTVTGNNIQSNGHRGIRLEYSDYNTITGNNIQSNGYHGIYPMGADNNTITGNNIQSNGRHGIYLLWRSDNNTVVGNTVAGNSQAADVYYDGIYLSMSDYNNIQGNTVRHAGGGKQHRYGINVSNATCDGNLVTNNDLYQSGRTGSFNDAGTGTITVAGNRL